MRLTDYCEAAHKTAPKDQAPKEALKNGAMGLGEEVLEFFKAKRCNEDEHSQRKELGDICWYLAQIINATHSSSLGKYFDLLLLQEQVVHNVNSNKEVFDTSGLLLQYAPTIIGGIKKYMYQGHEFDNRIVAYAAILMSYIEAVNPGVLHANVLKLKARYPDGFDSERSINRED